jgi:acetyl-CoA carboxylase carboxyl transferase subunit alpha
LATPMDFEKPIVELEARIAALKESGGDGRVDLKADIGRLESKVQALLKQTYDQLTPWQKTQVARHPARPHFKQIVSVLFDGFESLAGDRAFGEDAAIVGGLARFRGRSVMVMGHEKGDDTQGRIRHNFGMARPEGYRKAVRLLTMADRFGLPVITLVDTPGAFPGVQAEERGQAEAIARSTEACLALRAPLIACIVGEGGSGGAVALATGNRVLMYQNAVYSVISPEGCASILWRTSDKASEAAAALKLTAQDLLSLGVIDAIVPEPTGGAHRSPRPAIDRLGNAIEEALASLDGLDADALRRDRRERFLKLGRLN